MTCTRSLDVFRIAGEKGFNVLTGLIFLTAEQLEKAVQTYRDARAAAGYDRDGGTITLMLHTFLASDIGDVRPAVKEPLCDYLRSSVDLWRHENKSLERLKSRNDAIEFAFQRYFTHSGLFGTVDSCTDRVQQLAQLGVGEIACMVDFGIDTPRLRESLAHLSQLVERVRG